MGPIVVRSLQIYIHCDSHVLEGREIYNDVRFRGLSCGARTLSDVHPTNRKLP